ncbi:MAG: YceD family protein [Pseudomonadota bacterium]
MTTSASKTGNSVILIADAAGRGASFERTFKLADLPRLAAIDAAARQDSVGGSALQTQASIAVSVMPAAHPARGRLVGRVQATVGVMCQRCLELMTHQQDVEVDVLLTPSEVSDEVLAEAGLVGERWDHDADELDLVEWTDELVALELPMVLRHERLEDCGLLAQEATPVSGGVDADRQTPFADLAAMMAARKE